VALATQFAHQGDVSGRFVSRRGGVRAALLFSFEDRTASRLSYLDGAINKWLNWVLARHRLPIEPSAVPFRDVRLTSTPDHLLRAKSGHPQGAL
jgi:hypothetical protein